MRHQMHARFDDHRISALCVQRSFDGIEDFRIGECEALDVRTIEIGEMDGLQLIGLHETPKVHQIALRVDQYRRQQSQCGYEAAGVHEPSPEALDRIHVDVDDET